MPLNRDIALQFVDLVNASNGFPCHEKHPAESLITEAAIKNGKYHTTDCVGYAIWGLTQKEKV
tara:strand:- start:824 stop:1012 length:189 start_codon:yes stop_codon:yes gene_type:complete